MPHQLFAKPNFGRSKSSTISKILMAISFDLNLSVFKNCFVLIQCVIRMKFGMKFLTE